MPFPGAHHNNDYTTMMAGCRGAVHERSHSDTRSPLPAVELCADSSNSVISLGALPLRKTLASGTQTQLHLRMCLVSGLSYIRGIRALHMYSHTFSIVYKSLVLMCTLFRTLLLYPITTKPWLDPFGFCTASSRLESTVSRFDPINTTYSHI